MSKLVYPNDGIYKYGQSDLDACSNNLQQALASCHFDIPSGFSERSYLNNLDNVIRKYNKEINDIGSKLNKTDNRYEKLEDDLHNSTKRLENRKIVDRDRMII